MAATLTKFNIKYSQNDIDQWKGRAKKEVFQQYIMHEGLLNIINQDFISNLGSRYKEDPNVTFDENIRIFFNDMRARGKYIALNTGYSRETADILINRFNLYDCVDFTITSDEVPKSRPEPHMINQIMKVFNVKPEECLVVGDTKNDVLAGKNAGTLTAIINKNSYGANYVISNVLDIKQLI